MASVALKGCQGARTQLLQAADAECVALAGRVPAAPLPADLALRGYVVQLAAQFQGFARELYDECSAAVRAAVPPPLALLLQAQFDARRELYGTNARYEAVRADFERFDLNLPAALAVRVTKRVADGWVTDLTHLNQWRNFVAHDNPVPPAHGGPLTVTAVRQWRATCDGFAAALDAVLYDHLLGRLGTAPW